MSLCFMVSHHVEWNLSSLFRLTVPYMIFPQATSTPHPLILPFSSDTLNPSNGDASPCICLYHPRLKYPQGLTSLLYSALDWLLIHRKIFLKYPVPNFLHTLIQFYNASQHLQYLMLYYRFNYYWMFLTAKYKTHENRKFGLLLIGVYLNV